MAGADLITQLNEAITLFKAGYRAEARQRLQQLALLNPTAPQIWLWLATVSDSVEERIAALRHVLTLDPTNDKARQALSQLTGEVVVLPSPSQAAPPSQAEGLAEPLPPPPNMMATLEMLGIAVLAIVALVLLVGLYSSAISPRLFPTPTWTPSRTPIPTWTPSPTRTLIPTITPGGPTLTPLGSLTLPPTWTPPPLNQVPPTRTPVDTQIPPPTNTVRPTMEPSVTFTPFPTKTPFPTDTPFPSDTPQP